MEAKVEQGEELKKKKGVQWVSQRRQTGYTTLALERR
jgi:hypothetical protein